MLLKLFIVSRSINFVPVACYHVIASLCLHIVYLLFTICLHLVFLLQMEDWLSYTVSICGSRCELINLGQSYEGRNIWIVKVTSMWILLFIEQTLTNAK